MAESASSAAAARAPVRARRMTARRCGIRSLIIFPQTSSAILLILLPPIQSPLRMAQRAPIAIIIPTKNEEVNLPFALASVADWAEQVFVLDSGSTDRTEQIANQHGAQFVYHPWEGYARQKNWGLDNLPITTPWIFILDADEVITPQLRDELTRIATANNCHEAGVYVNRYLIFLGKKIKHCGYYPSWNVRFFRRGKARYEERQGHEHMIVNGRAGYLKRGGMEQHDRGGHEHFIAKKK